MHETSANAHLCSIVVYSPVVSYITVGDAAVVLYEGIHPVAKVPVHHVVVLNITIKFQSTM